MRRDELFFVPFLSVFTKFVAPSISTSPHRRGDGWLCSVLHHRGDKRYKPYPQDAGSSEYNGCYGGSRSTLFDVDVVAACDDDA